MNVCKSLTIVRHMVTLDIWLVTPPLAINGHAIQSKTGISKVKIIKIKPVIAIMPDMLRPTTSLYQG